MDSCYVIVKFIEEHNAPGIVAHNWIHSNGTLCYYPNVLSDTTRDKLLKQRAKPESNWLTCAIEILKGYESYSKARLHLRKFEETSNLDSNEGELQRKKVRKHITISEESDDEDFQVHSKKTNKEVPYPLPPSQASDYSQSSILSAKIGDDPEEQYSYSKQNGQTDKDKSQKCICTSDTVSLYGSPLNELFKQQRSKISEVLKQQSLMKSVLSDVLDSISRLESRQSQMMSMLSDSFNSNSRLESKLGSLVVQTFPSIPILQENELSLLQSLPTQSDEKFAALLKSLPTQSDENFTKLNKRLEEDDHEREHLVNYLSCIGGKDIRSLICNMLRRLLVDDVAQNFSLTGKQHKKSHKKAFEATEVYKAIFDISRKYYPNITQDKVRHICGDWLHQAKVRINRLKQRKVASKTNLGEADECNL